MSFRILTNVPSLQAQRSLSKVNNDLQSNFERLSSGSRINKAADDAAGLAVSEGLKAKERGLNQAKRNANDGISILQVAEGSMQEMGNIMLRLKELNVQAASDSISDKERSFLNKEYTQLVGELDRISNSTEFNGIKLMDGSKEDLALQVGDTNDPNSVITFDLSEFNMNSEVLGLGTEAEIGPTSVDGSGPDREAIAENLGKIDEALTKISTARSYIGSVQSRLQSAINNIEVSVENTAASASRIKDTDFAEETASLAQNRILSQAATSVLSQANYAPESALQLLRG